MQLIDAHERCRESLIWAIGQLKGRVEPAQLDSIAELIIQTMTGTWRYFHTPEHIFEVGGSQDPIEVLAALFHDMVYVQVDQGVNLNIGRYITPFVREKGQLTIHPQEELSQDRMFEIVATIFGFVPSQALSPFAGQNEFLSAIVAAKCLEPFLAPGLIAQIVACIEATIPFRSHNESGLTPAERLLERMRQANEQFNFGWTETETVDAVKRSVRLANRDVENFASPSSANFLDNTWNLIPETNHELITAAYGVGDYRRSMQKMQGFMSFLKPEVVFHQFRGEPDDETYRSLLAQTQKNLDVAKLYLGVKLVTMAILEALSYRLGQNIPLSTMMGEFPVPGIAISTLEQFLPDIQVADPAKTPLENEVVELLDKGRNQESRYDIKNSPLSTFIIKSIGFVEMNRLLLLTKKMFDGQMSGEEFLSHCDAEMIDTIVSSVAQLFESRTKALRGFNLPKVKLELSR